MILTCSTFLATKLPRRERTPFFHSPAMQTWQLESGECTLPRPQVTRKTSVRHRRSKDLQYGPFCQYLTWGEVTPKSYIFVFETFIFGTPMLTNRLPNILGATLKTLRCSFPLSSRPHWAWPAHRPVATCPRRRNPGGCTNRSTCPPRSWPAGGSKASRQAWRKCQVSCSILVWSIFVGQSFVWSTS